MTMRDRFVHTATDLLDTDDRVAVVLAAIGVDRFQVSGAIERHPDRVIDVGIREQALVSVAGGVALAGLRPIVHTYAPFLVERAFEQVKLDLGHQGVGAILVSVGASHDWAAGGATHFSPRDVPMLATLPDTEIQVPAHPDDVESVLRRAATETTTTYLRLSDPLLDVEPISGLSDGIVILRRGSPQAPTVLAVGPLAARAVAATEGLDVTVLGTARVRPLDVAGLRAGVTGDTILVAEPYLAGTSVDTVAEALSDRPMRYRAAGVGRAELRRYGTAAQHDAAHGIDVAGLRGAVPIPA